MADSFDSAEFGWYLHRQWRLVAVCCATAVVLALGASALMQRRFTATAILVIQPPGGADPRGATAVSPVYLESLKTYELMAASDSLFQEAVEHLHLRARYPGKSIESLKRSVLAVSKPVNTRLIHISATLDDAKSAQAMAQYLAERTVALSRSVNERSGAEGIREAEAVFEKARRRLDAATKGMDGFIAKLADGAAPSQMEAASELRYQAMLELNKAEAELAGLVSQQAASGSAPTVPGWLPAEIASVRARAATLRTQRDLLSQVVGDSGKRTERLQSLRDALEAELKSARTGYDAANNRLDEVKSMAAVRGESLEVLERGIVPERPSSPKLMLNCLAALFVSFIASILWLAARFGLERALQKQRAREYLLL